MSVLVWFRADLRARDNTALDAAARAAPGRLIGVFAICAGQWREHHWGGAKVDFVLRSVRALRDELAKLHIPLMVVQSERFDAVPGVLLRLARAHECSALYFNREHEVNELCRDTAVRAAFEADGRPVHDFNDQTILDVAALRTQAGGWYSVFTPFRRRWCAALKAAGDLPELTKPKRQQPQPQPADEMPASLPGMTGAVDVRRWPAGERAAQRRLDTFIAERIEGYAVERDRPAVDGTSSLSPYLACGVLSPRQCLRAALDANAGRVDAGAAGVVTWISELIWREFYRHILIGFPRVCRGQPFRAATRSIRWSRDEGQFAAWCAGRTGFPIVDAGLRQLAATGWMHNRVRMIVAMFLTKDLFIDWRWGERFFMEQLVDGDFASNNGGWQWSSSTGTDAAPYFRVFNPAKQSQRFDAAGDYIRGWVAELAKVGAGEIHDPGAATRTACGYPAAIVDRTRTRERVVAAFRRVGRGG